MLDLGAFMIKRLGHEALLANDGIKGETLAFTERPAVILLDVSMPLQDGFETLLHLRSSGYKGQIIMVSALKYTGNAERAKRLGADDYWTKPFETQALAARLSAVAGVEH